MDISIEQAYPLVQKTLQAQLVPFLSGAPGVGKTHLVHKLAKDYNLFLIETNLVTANPTDIGGILTLNEARTFSKYVPLESLPTEDMKVPDGYNGWLVFFDEMPSATLSVQAAAHKVIDERKVGQKKLHKRAAVICAGNRVTDRAVVNKVSTAMQSRLIHYSIMVSQPEWIEWAIQADIDYRIIGFIQSHPGLLHNFDPRHKDNTFPCPRTWHYLSRQIKAEKLITSDLLPLLAGTVGEGAAFEFKTFAEVMEQLAPIEEFIKDPSLVPIKATPNIHYGISALFGYHMSSKNIAQLTKAITRLPIEFQIITFRKVFKQKRELYSHEAVQQWIEVNGEPLV